VLLDYVHFILWDYHFILWDYFSLFQVINNRLHANNGFTICLTDVQDCRINTNVFFGQGDKTISSDEASLCTTTNNEIQPVPERSKEW